MSSRETVLESVRRALGRKSGQPPQPLPDVRLRIPEMPIERRIGSFRERLEELGGIVHRAATLEDARTVVAQLLPGPAVASNAPILRLAGITELPGVTTGFRDCAALRAACAATSCGITGADFGLAETGTLVMIASPNEARLVSLLPPVHIAVLALKKLLTGLDELYTLNPKPADNSSSMVFITGPSRSADIEMILVRGVHGPGVIHVIVVEDDAG